MIRIKNGKFDNIKDIIIYPPSHIFNSILIRPFIEMLKERFNVTIFGYENNTGINSFEDVKIITIPEKINFFKLIGIKRGFKELKFDLLIDITDFNHIFSRIFRPALKISFSKAKDGDIVLLGDIIWDMNIVLGLLGINKTIKRVSTKRKNKGIYGIKTEIPKGWINIETEKDLRKIGHLYTLKNEIAAKAYLEGLNVTIFLLNESECFIPKDIQTFMIKSMDEIKNYIYEDSPYLI